MTSDRAKRPPVRGVRAGEAGVTWWGLRWLEALERTSGGYSARFARGRSYARNGRAQVIEVKPGRVKARVIGSRVRPYRVALELTVFSDVVWSKVMEAMASRAQFAADLLAGEMPRGIDEVFRVAGVSLFPDRDDLETWCTCPDRVIPCKHVAATHYVLGEALDRDPFLLFELRGRTRYQILAGLRAARTGTAQEPARKLTRTAKKPASTTKAAKKSTRTAKKPTRTAKKPTRAAKKSTRTAKKSTRTAKKPTRTAKKPTRTAKKPTRTARKPTRTAKKPTRTARKPAVRAARKPARAASKLARAAREFAVEADVWRGSIPDLELSLDQPGEPGVLLGQLGPLPSWTDSRSPAELLAPLVSAAAEHALQIALSGGPRDG